MTIDITRLQELERNATPGPWVHSVMTCEVYQHSRIYGADSGEIATIRAGATRTKSEIPEQDLRDAEFIHYIRNALPALLSELETLRALVSDLAASEPWYDTDLGDEACALCGAYRDDGHEGDCLISRAREAMKTCIA